jgi:TPR repeat protein
MYLYGRGVHHDYVRAATLLVKPAEAGDPHAQNALGKLYERGLGLPQSDELAIKWYALAAGQGHEIAASNLRRLEQNP